MEFTLPQAIVTFVLVIANIFIAIYIPLAIRADIRKAKARRAAEHNQGHEVN